MTETERLAEDGRRLASKREDLIAAGVNPDDLAVPLHPVGSEAALDLATRVIRDFKLVDPPIMSPEPYPTWTLDGTRKWYCPICARFTDWEFRPIPGSDREDERCTEHGASI